MKKWDMMMRLIRLLSALSLGQAGEAESDTKKAEV